MKRIVLALALLAGLAPTLEAQQVFRFDTAPRRAWLGFAFERAEERRPGETTLTLRVNSVVAASPAERAGLRSGDAILRINGLNATEQLLSTLGTSMEPGDTVTFRVRRDGGERDLRIVAGEPPASSRPRVEWRDLMVDSAQRLMRLYMDSAAAGGAAFQFRRGPGGDSIVIRQFRHADSLFTQLHGLRDSTFAGPDGSRLRIFRRGLVGGDTIVIAGDSAQFFRRFEFPFGGDDAPGANLFVRSVSIGTRAVAGAEMHALNPELARYFDTTAGVLVLDVPENTPARRAGLQAGDVITAVAGASVRSVPELRRAVERASGGEVRVDYIRSGQQRTLQLKK